MTDITDGERIAEERIAEAARTGQDWLDLGDLDLISLPYGIRKLQSLRRLSIGGVFTVTPTGFRPRDGKLSTRKISDIDAISGLKNLQFLHLGFSRIADLKPIAKLGLLEHLDFAATAVKDLAPISTLVSLKALIFWHTDITDLTPISGIHRLQNLDFSHTQISDLSPIARLQELTHLSFNNTQVSDLAPIALLQQLQVLRCSETKIHDLSPISDLQQLRELICEGTLVGDLSPMVGLEQLEHLDCSRTGVTDLSPISGLQQIRHLDFSNTQVSDLTQITAFKNLTTLVAKNCLVSSLPREINRLQRLQLLDLMNNKLRTLPRELAELRKVEAASRYLSSDAVSSGLFLEGNPLEAPIPELIAPGQPQATINVLRWLRNEPIETEAKEPDTPTPEESADDPPAIPEQGAGPRVVLDQTGRLVFAKPSDLDAKGNDRNRLQALHPALREAAADLVKALQDHPSNLRNERLLQKTEAYRALVDLPLDEVNFARLYGAGMQLLNAAAATRRALEAGRTDVPELTPVQDECLANIENLHPPFVLASRDGQEMLADQTTIKLTAEAVEGIKEAGTELGAELINDPDLADREVGETIRDAAAEIGRGENEARDAVNTVSTMRNAVIVLTTASKWTITGAVVGFAVGGPPGAIAAGGATLWWYGTKVAEKTKAFQADADRAAKALDAEAEKLPIIRNRMARHQRLLLKVEPKLRKITQLPGFTWLGPSLDWLKRNSPPDKKG
jgi:Leucine-rich repeat (LRR) protein